MKITFDIQQELHVPQEMQERFANHLKRELNGFHERVNSIEVYLREDEKQKGKPVGTCCILRSLLTDNGSHATVNRNEDLLDAFKEAVGRLRSSLAASHPKSVDAE